MPLAERPRVYTIPPHGAFVDALAAGLLERTKDDPLALARARILLPNRRAVRALTDAFVRRSDGGLLLPRMTPIGDLDADGFATEAASLDLPPAFDPCERRLRLTQLVRRGAARRGDGVTAVEALRLADALGSALDELTGEEVDPAALATLVENADLAEHFQLTLDQFDAVREHWPAVLAATGTSDAVARRLAVVDAVAREWAASPPAGLIVAAGLVAVSPAVARLLRVVARLPDGLVVLPGVDTAMDDEEWDAIRVTAEGGDEAHPQYMLKRLLDRIDVGRGEVAGWDYPTASDGPVARTGAVASALRLAKFTTAWRDAPPEGVFDGVRTVEAATPAEEAQVVALALRRALAEPGQTAALVTPDRNLARRVARHLARWGIDIDDSAGLPLRQTPPGAMILALAEAATQGFAPVALLAVLKHPLVRFGPERLAWLDRVRALDRRLRGVRPVPGLAGVTARLKETKAVEALTAWWTEVAEMLAPLEAHFTHEDCALADAVAVLRDTGEALAGDELWRGPAGRALGGLVAMLTEHGRHLDPFAPADAPALLGSLLRDVPVREAYGKQPRLAIYGTLEARLQRADLTILGGLNEGVWPSPASPDPWLALKIRAELGIGGTQRGIGLAAHDFAAALGGPQVLLTRARRDDSAPTVASRFWLRLHASVGDALKPETELLALARALDRSAVPAPAPRPEPAPSAAMRPRKISVTAAEQLKADPFSWYARAILELKLLDPLDADPGAAERGIDLHDVLEKWIKGGGEPDALQPIAATMLREKWSNHPLMQALWKPRVERALDWVVEESARWHDAGWSPHGAEVKAVRELRNGVTLQGRADRVDHNAAGALAIIDYKTGKPPSNAQVQGGFALQMGLLAWLIGTDAGAAVEALRYWRLSGGKEPGDATDPLAYRGKPFIELPDHVAATIAAFDDLCEKYLLGSEPFTAKLHPEYAARYSDFDHLARVAEWQARAR
ncbi:double-strand break repair protein AddB [Glacieibacterium frigidum]|uniref:Double-strand break repair protein AddB n=1 Tax=Glacieibacterium frigidum TaxID=2593303 RepID=A0A552U8X9_9SPHN|nr:double-strand break repair protein AddB [Glacieibacterium frigidum]TRW14684.1 double-strand break repair protein AddB [Glacieibacterium frigidum]